MLKKKVVDIRHAKSEDYKEVLNNIEKIGKCPFCKENFKYHKHPILNRKTGWFITKSTWPYKNTRYHFLIISEKHKESLNQLNLLDLRAVSYLIKWIIKKCKIRGGGLALRFGDTIYTGSTVCHLHFHLIVPGINKKTKRVKAICFPIG